MAGIDIRNFGGVISRLAPTQVPPEGPVSAAYATAVLFDREGAITSLPITTEYDYKFTGVSGVDTIFPYYGKGDRVWMRWTGGAVQVALSPVRGDTQGRIYWVDSGVDGPQMTYNSLVNVNGSFTSRPLGVPAPADPPTLNGGGVQDAAVSGTITAVTCASLGMVHERKGSEGQNSGYGETNVVSTTTPTYLKTLPVGTRLKVASIVDANTVTVTGVSGAAYSCWVDKLDYGLKWTNSNGDNLWRRRKKAFWNFTIPSGATLTITAHPCKVGDIIQVTATPTPMTWEFATLATTPNTERNARTATKSAGGNIAFAGSCNFIVDRGGATIDPLTPNTNVEVETRIYVYTYVTDLGEEGPPSKASDIVTIEAGGSVTVDGFSTPAVDGRVIDTMRIYRANTGTDATELQFVAEIPITDTSYVDSKTAEELGEVIQTESWELPYNDLITIRTLPNGAMVGAVGNTLCFSEPNYPHAWPPEYEYPIDYEITAVEVLGDTIIVGTKGHPYVFSGVHPRQMSSRKLDVPHACLSLRAMCSMGDAVAYVAPEGIVRVSPNGAATVITDGLITRGEHVQHLDMTDGTIGDAILWYYENTLFFSGLGTYGNVGDGYIIRIGEDGVMRLSSAYDDHVYRTSPVFDPRDGQMYSVGFSLGDSTAMYAYPPNRSNSSPGSLNAVWGSREFEFPRPVNLQYARVYFIRAPSTIAAADPGLTVTHIQLAVEYREPDGELTTAYADVHNGVLEGRPSDKVFALDSGVRSDRIQVSVSVNGYEAYVTRVRLGETIDDVVDQDER